MLPKVLSLQLGFKGCIRGFRVDGLLLKDRQDAHGFLKKFKAGLEVHSEVASDPDNSFPHVFLLLQHEHGVVEELLQLFVDKIDADLFESVKFEDLKAGDVQHANEGDFLHSWVNQCAVAHVDDVTEKTPVDVLDD